MDDLTTEYKKKLGAHLMCQTSLLTTEVIRFNGPGVP